MSFETKSSSKINTVGVIGAGQMGNGIAHICATSGYHVLIHDSAPEQIKKALAKINKNMNRQVESGKLTAADKSVALGRIKAASGFDDFADCQLVIEAVTENEAIKQKIFADLSSTLSPSAILATNTSSLSVTRLATTIDRPQRFVGIHFMNPVPVMQLVELIRGIATDEHTFNTAKKFTQSLGKVVTISEDFPGFTINRILLPMINEAVYTLYEGVASIESIDTSMKFGANHPMGPLELADFIGLDTCLSIMQILYQGLSDCKYRPCPLLIKYVEAGWLGRKTNRGFYDYNTNTPIPTRQILSWHYPNDGWCEKYFPQEVCCGFIITPFYGSELCRLIDKVLNQVTPFGHLVGQFVEKESF